MITCSHCGKDGCTGDPLVMHGRCHISSPTYAILGKIKVPGDKLSVYCAECDKLIVRFEIEPTQDMSLDSPCHSEAEVWVMLHNQTDLTVNCSACELEFAKFKLVGMAPRAS